MQQTTNTALLAPLTRNALTLARKVLERAEREWRENRNDTAAMQRFIRARDVVRELEAIR